MEDHIGVTEEQDPYQLFSVRSTTVWKNSLLRLKKPDFSQKRAWPLAIEREPPQVVEVVYQANSVHYETQRALRLITVVSMVPSAVVVVSFVRNPNFASRVAQLSWDWILSIPLSIFPGYGFVMIL